MLVFTAILYVFTGVGIAADNAQVETLGLSPYSFTIRTGDYFINYNTGDDSDGWISIYHKDSPDRIIGTKLVSGAGFNPTDIGDPTVYKWDDPRKDSRILKLAKVINTPDTIEWVFDSERHWAKFQSKLITYKRYPGLIHWTVDLTAKTDKTFNTAPEMDCHFMGVSKSKDKLEYKTHEVVRYMQQRCNASGIAYFRDISMGSSVFYFEDFTSLNSLYKLTGFSNPFAYPSEGPSGAVKIGEPFSDFQLSTDGDKIVPAKPFQHQTEQIWNFGYERPYGFRIPKGTKLTIADTYLYLKPDKGTDNISICKDFVESLADVYRFIKKPPVINTDWAGTVVPRMIDDIMREPNINIVDGKYLFPRAYVNYGYQDNQLWTLVQLLHPLGEYVKKYPNQKKAAEFKRRLEESLPLFYDKDYKGFYNNLPPVEAKRYFHSVYIFIPTAMVADIALQGNKDARMMIEGFRDRLILMGKNSGYVFADMWIDDYSKQNGYYQLDETGMYIYIMMALYEMSGGKDTEALESAKAAAEKMTDRCMDLGWQVNMTASGAIGCEKLYKATGNSRYRDIAYIPLANTLRQAWLWECDYGVGEKTTTFWAFCGTPAAPSSAEFETHRTRFHLKQYQELAKNHLPANLDSMLSDSWQVGPVQSRFTLPPFLVEAGASKYIATQGKLETDCGEIRYDQMIPLEDVRGGWCTDLEWWNNNTKLGAVGQEIYGAGGMIWYAVWQDQLRKVKK